MFFVKDMSEKCVERNFKNADNLTFLAATHSSSDTLGTLEQNIIKLSIWFRKWRIKAAVTKTKTIQLLKQNQSDCEPRDNLFRRGSKSKKAKQ